MLSTAGLGDALADFDAGQSWEVSSPAGRSGLSSPDMEEAAFPDAEGRVLVGQFTTDGYVLGR